MKLLLVFLFLLGVVSCSTTTDVSRNSGQVTDVPHRDGGVGGLWKEDFEVRRMVSSGILLDIEGTYCMELELSGRSLEQVVKVFVHHKHVSVRTGAGRPGHWYGDTILPSGPEATALAAALSRAMGRFEPKEVNNAELLIEALSGKVRPFDRRWQSTRGAPRPGADR